MIWATYQLRIFIVPQALTNVLLPADADAIKQNLAYAQRKIVGGGVYIIVNTQEPRQTFVEDLY